MAKQFLSAISCYPGSVGAPGLYLGTDTTTGLYRIGANNLGISISGSKVVDISSTGLNITGTVAASAVSVGVYTNGVKESYFGYSSTYKTIQLGELGSSRAISLGADLTSNASGSFQGNEIVIPNAKAMIAPNAANNGYVGVLRISASNILELGSADYSFTTPYMKLANGAVSSPSILTLTGNISLPAATSTDSIYAHNNTYGAVVYGYGSTYDAALLDRNTNPIIGVSAGSATVTGNAYVSGKLTTPAQFYNVFISQGGGSGGGGVFSNGVKIKTNIPAGSGYWNDNMTTLWIEGYDYRTGSNLDLTISWYGYSGGNTFLSYSVSSYGGVAPTVTLSVESGKAVINLSLNTGGFTDGYYLRLSCRAYDSVNSISAYTGWAIVDEGVTGTQSVAVPYRSRTGILNVDGNLSANNLSISGTTKAAGYFDAGTVSPTNTNRLNYDGYFYATRFYGDGSQLTNLPANPDVLAFAAAYG